MHVPGWFPSINVAVSTGTYPKYTKTSILTIGSDPHGPGDVTFTTRISLTPPADGVVVLSRI